VTLAESDLRLLERYARDGAEDAFRGLVTRHVDLVYSIARRVVGDPQLAEDVTQTVFTDFARKAWSLPADTVVAGWLYQAARFAAAKAVRAESRRRARETAALEAHMQTNEPEPDWEQLRPLLDEAMDQLPPADRDAVVLRYYQRRDLREVGAALSLTDEAARKRVSRALDKLREFLARRGLTTTATALAATISAHAVQTAPAGLAASVLAGSLAAGATVATGTAFVLKLIPSIAMTKTQVALVTAAAVAAGVGTPLLLQHSRLARLDAELAALRAQAAEAETLRAENTRLSQIAVDAGELDNLRRDKAELLRLRGEVTRLREQAATVARPPATATQRVRRERTAPPSPLAGQPGYVPAEQFANAGLATPEAALQTFFWALENPVGGRLLKTLVLPEEVQQALAKSGTTQADLAVAVPFSGPPPGVEATVADGNAAGARLDFIQGEGAGDGPKLTQGYRVVSQTEVSPDERQVEIERALASGDVHRESHTLRKVGDEWKVQPGGNVQVFAGPGGGVGVMVQQSTTSPDGSGTEQVIRVQETRTP